MSQSLNCLSHKINASVTWKIANITICRRCFIGVAFEKICCDYITDKTTAKRMIPETVIVEEFVIYNTDNIASLSTEENHISIHTTCSTTLHNQLSIRKQL